MTCTLFVPRSDEFVVKWDLTLVRNEPLRDVSLRRDWSGPSGSAGMVPVRIIESRQAYAYYLLLSFAQNAVLRVVDLCTVRRYSDSEKGSITAGKCTMIMKLVTTAKDSAQNGEPSRRTVVVGLMP